MATLKCFYCGRVVKIQEQDGKFMAKCNYPRCRLQPETDWEESEDLVELDWLAIKDSLKGK